jgi:hypothetical protein
LLKFIRSPQEFGMTTQEAETLAFKKGERRGITLFAFGVKCGRTGEAASSRLKAVAPRPKPSPPRKARR